MLRKIYIFILLITISVWTALISSGMEARDQEKTLKPGLEVLVRPDLTVENIEIESESLPSGKIRLTIKYTIYNNSSVHTKCCPTEEGKKAWAENPVKNQTFEITVESRVSPLSDFVKLTDETTGTMCKPYERQTFDAEETVSAGVRWEFRVKVDSGNWINETNEENNEKTQIWRSMAIKK